MIRQRAIEHDPEMIPMLLADPTNSSSFDRVHGEGAAATILTDAGYYDQARGYYDKPSWVYYGQKRIPSEADRADLCPHGFNIWCYGCPEWCADPWADRPALIKQHMKV